jgi:hypothetical protein
VLPALVWLKREFEMMVRNMKRKIGFGFIMQFVFWWLSV